MISPDVLAHHLDGNQYWYVAPTFRSQAAGRVPTTNYEALIPGSYYSPSMEHKVGYMVYLPPDYNPNGAPYPVIYFLHGINGNEVGYFMAGNGYGDTASLYNNINLVSLVKNAHSTASPRDTILVFVNGGRASFYIDYDGFTDINGQDHHSSLIAPKYPGGVGDPFPNPWPNSTADFRILSGTTIIDELIPHIDATYNTKNIRSGRALEGFSMGGGGAWRLALQHPDKFCSSVAYAPAGLNEIIDSFNPPYGKPLLSRDAASQIAQSNASNIISNNLKLRTVTGGGDSSQWYNDSVAVRNALIANGVSASNVDVAARPAGVGHSIIALNTAAGQESFDFHWNCFEQQSASIPPSPPPSKPGDIDGNNKVDIFDYNILLTDFGKTGNLPADIDKNGKVDIFDYSILLTNFGT